MFVLAAFHLFTYWQIFLSLRLEFPSFRTCLEFQTEVHSMHLGLKISGVEIAFLSAWRRGYSLNYILWCTGVVNANLNQRTILLIFAPQVYTNCQCRCTPEGLLAYLWCAFYMECTLGFKGTYRITSLHDSKILEEITDA